MFRFPYYSDVVVRGLNGFLRFGLRYAVGHPERFKGAVREGYLAPYDSWANRIAVHRFVEEIPLHKKHHNQTVLEYLNTNVGSLSDRPHMVIWGKKDWVFHTGYLAKWQEAFPAAEVHVFDDASHWVVEEAHERILPLMKTFLSEHPLE